MKVLFYTGKGGVGKSTVSAATAWQLSQRHKVLAVSLDPAHNLGDIFGVTLNAKKHRFSENLFLRELDLGELSRAYLEREMAVLAQAYKYTQALSLDSYFSILKYSPGIEEYALLTGIEEILRAEAGFDYLVFDTPPTGLTLRFLALPRVTLTWLERLIHMRRVILDKRHTIGKILAPGGARSAGEQRLAYDESEDRVLGRLLDLERRHKALSETLRGADCSIAVVFNPDVLSMRESERLIEGLRELGLPLRLLIANKVGPGDHDAIAGIESRLQALAPQAAVARVAYAPALHDGNGSRLYQIPENITEHLFP